MSQALWQACNLGHRKIIIVHLLIKLSCHSKYETTVPSQQLDQILRQLNTIHAFTYYLKSALILSFISVRLNLPKFLFIRFLICVFVFPSVSSFLMNINHDFINYDFFSLLLLLAVSYGVGLNRSWSDGEKTLLLLVLNSAAMWS